MRILHLFDHSLPLQSGYTFRSAAILREQRRLGWEVTALTGPRQNSGDRLEETVGEFTFLRTPAPRTGNDWLKPLLDIRAMKRRLREVIPLCRPDLIHAHSPALNGVAALGAAQGIPVVYEIRAFWEDAAVSHGTCRQGDLRYRLTRALETHVLRRAQGVAVICQGLKEEVLSRGGLDAERLVVIPNGVDVEAFPPRAMPDADPSRRGATLGFIGSFYAYEGLDTLIAAMPALLRVLPDTRLFLVGGGPEEEALRRQVAVLGLQESVILPGRVAHQEVGRYYDRIEIFVYPRQAIRLTELVTPLKPLEAMASGKLVAASDISGHRELIRHGSTGWLFPADDVAALADCLIRRIADRASWPQICRQARDQVVRERTWQVSVAGYEALYQRLFRLRDGKA
ncbi:MAG: glycosyltransferase, exosortase A system-associated [Magnetococcales bacterium]|nr:glycosyltransferase, exosortase A system-associated [Magnetococcales bacterium]MBF0309560.1 glycosyltransferase, exosortase A system-associated [Magnetococcales bacterium]